MDAQGTNYLEYLQTLVDDPLHVARSVAHSGTSVVGFVGDEVPVSLIAAAGALPVRLRSVAGKPTARADEFLESAHAPELRIIVERWLTGELDFLSTVIFSRTRRLGATNLLLPVRTATPRAVRRTAPTVV